MYGWEEQHLAVLAKIVLKDSCPTLCYDSNEVGSGEKQENRMVQRCTKDSNSRSTLEGI